MKKKGSSGIALITVLWLSVIILILGLSFLSILVTDYKLSGHQRDNAACFYLARAGMEAYLAMGKLPDVDPESNERRVYIPPDSKTSYCVISNNNGDLSFRGTISDLTGRVNARRVLIAPGGNLDAWYEKY
ncbi:MAG: hypothetical protein M1536_08680 [Firmicutes bacterium]|nr:hypothetical protein [Bacillota bacterium]